MEVLPDLHEIAGRVVHSLRERVQRGEISERGLARLTGFSQPHIHNVLKGVRGMNLDLADHLLGALNIPLLSLFTQEELSGRAFGASAASSLPVPALDGYLGGGRRYPSRVTPSTHLALPSSLISRFINPVLAILDRRERSMLPALQPADIVLLDQAPRERSRPDFPFVYALVWKKTGYVAYCRVVGRSLVLATAHRPRIALPARIPLDQNQILDVVRGKIVWLAREMDEG
jgi:hypothetical protein